MLSERRLLFLRSREHFSFRVLGLNAKPRGRCQVAKRKTVNRMMLADPIYRTQLTPASAGGGEIDSGGFQPNAVARGGLRLRATRTLPTRGGEAPIGSPKSRQISGGAPPTGLFWRGLLMTGDSRCAFERQVRRLLAMNVM